MLARTVFGVLIMMLFLVQIGSAAGNEGIQKYFNDTACKVKAATDPAEKREILGNSLETMSKALDMVQSSQSVSEEDCAGINSFKATLQEKQDELAGTNGFEPVDDAQLNAFSDYVVQDMEQAEKTVTISLITALLIVIILILIL